MSRRTRSRGSKLLLLPSLGTLACSFLAPPDSNFLSAARGGSSSTDAFGGTSFEAGRAGASAGDRGGSSGNSSGGDDGPAASGGTARGGAAQSSGGERASFGGNAPTESGGGKTNSLPGAGGSADTVAGGGAGGAGSGSLGTGGGGADPPSSCSASTCGPNARCVMEQTGAHCVCDAALIPNGADCRLPISCDELHQRSPALPSSSYSIQPATAMRAEKVYCEMNESGGGWTLVMNEGVDFMPKTPGTDDAVCFEKNCTSSVYSTLPLVSDILLDVADEDIVADTYSARIRILGVNSASRGKTLRELFTSGPYFLERGDNKNLTVFTHDDQTCEQALPPDLATLACDTCQSADQPCGTPIITLGDADSICDPSLTFAIGASHSESESWTNCAGWPQAPFFRDNESNLFQFYPTNVRIWLR